MATKPGFTFNCSHCSSVVFTLTSYSLYTQGHANLIDFNIYRILFLASKQVRMVKTSPFLKKIPPRKISYFPLPVNTIWKAVLDHITNQYLWPANLTGS